MPPNQINSVRRKILLSGAIVVLIGIAYYLLFKLQFIEIMTDSDRLKAWVSGLGYAGPAAIVSLMAVAIVINPIPSAPIALAAGAAYGHFWGTIYIVAGATTGALIAFGIARILGHELMSKWFGQRLKLGWLGSQNSLTGMVFISRLVPFVSFDLVSYGAGLTPITPWRFFLATLVGLVPASFLLAHFGGELTAASLNRVLLIVLALGGMTLLPIGIKVLIDRARRRVAEE